MKKVIVFMGIFSIYILFAFTSCASLKPSDAKFVLEHSESVIATSFYQAENTLATLTSDGTITLWNTDNGEIIRRIDTNNKNHVTSLIYTGDNILAIYSNRDIIMYDPLNIEEPRMRFIPDGSVEQFVYFPKEKRVIFGIVNRTTDISGGSGSTVRLYTPTTVDYLEDNRSRETITSERRLRSVRFDNGPVIRDINLPTSRLITIENRTTSSFPSERTAEDRMNEANYESQKQNLERMYELTSMAISSDGIIACGFFNGEIILYDANTNRQLREFQNSDNNAVTALTFTSHGRYLLSGSSDRIVRLWDRENNWSRVNQRKVVSVDSLRFSPNGESFIAARAGSFLVVDARNGNILHTISGSRTESVFYKNNNEIIIVGTRNRSVFIW